MSFLMEVHHPGVHVPPADEAGGIVTRTTTRMRSPSANTTIAGSWSIWRRRIGESPIRWRRSHRRRRPQKFSATPNKEIPFGNCCAGAVNRGFSTFSTEAIRNPRRSDAKCGGTVGFGGRLLRATGQVADITRGRLAFVPGPPFLTKTRGPFLSRRHI
jgi:hypothetical protein